ncbi:MAG: hypothetical protein Q8K60_08240 [Parachlamydiaceae bacterium]|nr:hypothetical protein [Parachlamydiaceae bacterium]
MNSISLPVALDSYQNKLSYESEEEKIQIIHMIADRISSIYTAFLTPDWHFNHKKTNKCLSFSRGLDFTQPQQFPSKENVKKFQINLNETIVNELTKENIFGSRIYLSTSSEGLLDYVFKKNVSHENYLNSFLFFPIKTGLDIEVFCKKITIKMTPSIE